ncbi:hypothetical protein RJI07_01725 [Mycoplasmatota bacterium WC30]
MKKLLISLFILGLSFTLIACNTASEEEVIFETNDQVFTLEALSAASLLDYSNVATLSFVPLAEVTTGVTTEEEEILVDEEIDEIDKYLEMIENFLGDNEGLGITALESDRDEWEYKVAFSTVDMLGNEIEYVMYYTETLWVSETDDTVTTTEVVTTEEVTTEGTTTAPETTVPTTTEPATTVPETTAPETTEETTGLAFKSTSNEGEKNFYFEDDDDNEVAYSLTGLIISNGLEYMVEGKKVIEENGDECLRLRSFIDQDNFVKVSYKIDGEDSTRKFFFEVVEAGEVVSMSKVKVMEEESKLKVFLDMEQNGDAAKYVFKIIEEDGETIIHIKYDIEYSDGSEESGNIHIFATVDPETEEIIYTYKILGKAANGNQNTYKKEIEKKHENRGNANANSNSGNNGNGNI